MSEAIESWFAGRGWRPLDFQREAWAAYSKGESGLIAVPTGSGKTYSATLAAIAEGLPPGKLSILYLTPLRALARDISLSLQVAADHFSPGARVETRTGDTTSHRKARQLKNAPEILVTTPESLAVLLCQNDSEDFLFDLKLVVMDEWHELLGSKRGVFTELLLERLRSIRPSLRTWALSATIGNLSAALESAVGCCGEGRLIKSNIQREVDIEVVVPRGGEWIPWGGHLGLYCLEEVLEVLDPAESSLIFTNTRNQAESWYQAISILKEEWGEKLALHHGSLSSAERERVESGLKDGSIRVVVATSSLDLGVDFPAVDRVFQIGSPKSVARMVQRAGRTKHRPGERSKLFFVPTQLLECAEIEAVREAIASKKMEERPQLEKPLDVLAQHLVTLSCALGFEPEAAFTEVRRTPAYRNLEREEFDWVVEFLERGGKSLTAYKEYRKIAFAPAVGMYFVAAPRIARLHKLNIGTIQENATLDVRLMRGGKIGRVDESYLSRLKKGDRFYFAGRSLELVRLDEKGAVVKGTKSAPDQMPSWQGGRLPLSQLLCANLRPLFSRYAEKAPYGLERLLEQQQERSALPKTHELLLETWSSKEGDHLFVYPFEGRLVHEALASLLAYRLALGDRNTFSISANDYGFELVSAKRIDYRVHFRQELFSGRGVAEDVLASLNHTELEKRQFREIAKVGGLLYSRYPGQRKLARHLQASAALLFEVIQENDPENLLLAQARREVLEQQFELKRLEKTLERMRAAPFLWAELEKPSPFAFALMLERLSTRLSTESLKDRIGRMKSAWLR